MNKLHFIHTINYDTVVVSNNTTEQILTDEKGNEMDRFPAGLVLRWLPKGNVEPDIKFIEGKFTNDFKDDNEIREYIDNNKILD